MGNTYDLETAIGQVRLLISDTDLNAVVFADAEIDGFLVLEDENVRLAAAQALDTIASNEALVSKKIRTQNLQTDGPAVAKELRERAASLRAQNDQAVAAGEESEDEFAVAEFADPAFGTRDRLNRQALRGL